MVAADEMDELVAEIGGAALVGVETTFRYVWGVRALTVRARAWRTHQYRATTGWIAARTRVVRRALDGAAGTDPALTVHAGQG
jgi:hypothetical protein